MRTKFDLCLGALVPTSRPAFVPWVSDAARHPKVVWRWYGGRLLPPHLLQSGQAERSPLMPDLP